MSQNLLNIFKEKQVIAVIRSSDFQTAISMANAVAKGGIELIEITWNSEKPTIIVEKLQQELPNCLIGAGTILTLKDLNQAISCGCKFIFSPHTNLHLIHQANENNIPIIPGALTPTEIVNAWQNGATAVKVFPIESVGGAKYIKNLHSPLNHIPLIPTGGVNLENAKGLINAGGIAVGLSSTLFPKKLIQEKNWQSITDIAINIKKALSII